MIDGWIPPRNCRGENDGVDRVLAIKANPTADVDTNIEIEPSVVAVQGTGRIPSSVA
jgi:hypothetical protein